MTTPAQIIPEDHVTNFPPKWWTPRRKRDYFVDSDDCVRLHPYSFTGAKVAAALVDLAKELTQK